jgi:hypothetical protein
MNTGVPARRYNSVQQDWRAILPLAKGISFSNHTEELESAFLMFSVALDDSIALNRSGSGENASQGIRMVGELCALLALRITAVLHAMRQFSRHFGIAPNLAWLDASNFHSEQGQRAARHSNLVSHVLLSERSQFLNKVTTLEEIVDALGDEVIEVSRQLSGVQSAHSSWLWRFLDLSYFDLNTCLRETDILLKSFLFVLPDDQLAMFDFTVSGLGRVRRLKSYSSPELIRARRIATVAGE